MNRFYVGFYKKENGNCPMREFLESLDIKKRAKVLRMIHFLEENGNAKKTPRNEIIRAIMYRKDYFRRNIHE